MLILTPRQDYRFHGRDGSPSDAEVIRETWVENVYRIAAEDFGDAQILIDIGANIGSVSVYGASLGAHVIAVEPDPDNLVYLRRNFAANNTSESCTIIEAAVTDKPGILNLQPGHGQSQIVNRKSASTVQVTGITLADVYATADVPYCDVLKIDIEGAEYPLIASTSTEVLRKARYITLEFDAAPLEQFGAMVAKIACDFHVEILGSPKRGGYIYARRYDD